jgi:hypothetical protein
LDEYPDKALIRPEQNPVFAAHATACNIHRLSDYSLGKLPPLFSSIIRTEKSRP